MIPGAPPLLQKDDPRNSISLPHEFNRKGRQAGAKDAEENETLRTLRKNFVFFTVRNSTSNTPKMENELAHKVIGLAIDVHTTLGLCLLESAYQVGNVLQRSARVLNYLLDTTKQLL